MTIWVVPLVNTIRAWTYIARSGVCVCVRVGGVGGRGVKKQIRLSSMMMMVWAVPLVNIVHR